MTIKRHQDFISDILFQPIIHIILRYLKRSWVLLILSWWRRPRIFKEAFRRFLAHFKFCKEPWLIEEVFGQEVWWVVLAICSTFFNPAKKTHDVLWDFSAIFSTFFQRTQDVVTVVCFSAIFSTFFNTAKKTRIF